MSKAQASKPRELNRWWAMLLSLAGGCLMALAFIPFDYSYIVWIGLLPLLTVLWMRPRSFWGGFGYAWLYGMGYYGLSFWWIQEVGLVFKIPYGLFLGMAFLPLMACYSLLVGLWGGIASTLLRPKLSKAPEGLDEESEPAARKAAWREWALIDTLSTLRTAAGLAALWVCIEWLRASGTLGFSWNSLGMALYDGLALVQWAEFVGTSPLAFIPVFFGIILWCAARRTWLHLKGTGKGCRPCDFYGVVLILFGLMMGGIALSRQYSALQLFQKESVQALPVVAVQINLDQKERIETKYIDCLAYTQQLLNQTFLAFTDIQQKQVREAMKNPEVAIVQQLPVWVIWPESALGAPLLRNEANMQALSDTPNSYSLFSPESGLPRMRQMVREMGGQDFVLMTGGDELLINKEMLQQGMFNTLSIFENGLEARQMAAKQHLMPFGEYVPLVQDYKWIGDWYSEITGTQVGEGIRPGSGDEPLMVSVPGREEKIGVIPAICYEDTVGDLLRKFVRKGPQVIVNISNDAWFNNSACGEQQARAAAFRCIELRRPRVRAANNGLTCSIAPNGAFIDELRRGDGGPWRTGYSYALLPVDSQAGYTLYALWGDWAVLLCALLSAALAAFGFKKKSP